MDESGSLPFIDEHRLDVAAPPSRVWAALIRVVSRLADGGILARILGCDPLHAGPEFVGRVGDAVPGFRVAAVEPERRLELRGRHRFAEYALTFRLDPTGLTAVTHAGFPGLKGRAYRALVISSGAHAVVTRRLLRQVARAAGA